VLCTAAAAGASRCAAAVVSQELEPAAAVEKQAEMESDVADPHPDVLLAAVCAAEAVTESVTGKAEAAPAGPGSAVSAVVHAAHQAKPESQTDPAVAAAETAFQTDPAVAAAETASQQHPHAAAESALQVCFAHLVAQQQLSPPQLAAATTAGQYSMTQTCPLPP
jgi:hypothetical protein